jgi:hypothetical protein
VCVLEQWSFDEQGRKNCQSHRHAQCNRERYREGKAVAYYQLLHWKRVQINSVGDIDRRSQPNWKLSFPGKNGGYCDCRENGYGAGCYGRNRRNTDCRNNSSLGASDAFYECEHRAGEKDDRELLEVGSLDDLGCDMKPDCKADEEPGKSGQQQTGPISDRPRDDCQIDIKLDLARQRPKRPVDGGRLGIRLKYARQGIVNSEQDC